MLNDSTITALRSLAENIGPELAAPVDTAGLAESHRRLLGGLNGFTVYHGGFRVFGIRDEPELDIRAQNELETWRFAWDGRVDPYFTFAETAFGDQYAYKRDGAGYEPEIYWLDGMAMRPRKISETFDEWVGSHLMRNAREPIDTMISAAIERLGPLDSRNHLTYVPPIALGGAELLDNVAVMPAITAMTFNGDIATGLLGPSDDAELTGVEPWKDERGRDRLRLLWNKS